MKKIVFLLIFFTFLFCSCATQQKTIPVIPTPQIETIDQEKKQVIPYNSLDSQLENLTNQIVESLSHESKSKIAVVEFSDLNGNITEFGMYLSEELITRLFLTRKFDVIERQLLNKVLSEQKLGITGLIDDESAITIGKLLGVDAIVSGTITDLGKSLKVNARIISTETGKVFGVAGTKIVKDETVEKLIGIMDVNKVTEVQKPSNEEISLKVTKNIPINEFLYSGNQWEITLVSYELLPSNKIKFMIKVENKQNEPQYFSIERRIGNGALLLDNLTNEYDQYTVEPNKQVRLIPNSPINFYVTFSGLKENIEKLVLYLRFSIGLFNSKPIKIDKSYLKSKTKTIIEINDFTFELVNCKQTGQNIICDLLITNNIDEDRLLTLYGGIQATRIFDEDGNELAAQTLKLGNRGPSNRVSNTLVNGVPILTTLNFGSSSTKVKLLSLLEIHCHDKVSGRFKVRFRNISITK